MDNNAPTRFGLQPARAVMRAERWSFPLLAANIGVPPRHLYHAVRGIVRPAPLVRSRMPQLLGVELSDLFTDESLAEPYHPEFSPRTRASK